MMKSIVSTTQLRTLQRTAKSRLKQTKWIEIHQSQLWKSWTFQPLEIFRSRTLQFACCWNGEVKKQMIRKLKSYYDEKMLFLFSADSDFIFGKNEPCQLLRLNFKNKCDFFNYDFSFKLSAITRFCSSRVALRELDRERRWRHLLTSLIFQCVNPDNLVCKTAKLSSKSRKSRAAYLISWVHTLKN